MVLKELFRVSDGLANRLLRLKFYFESFIVTGWGIGVYDSNVWPHFSNVSLRFQTCSSMVRLVSYISLSL